MEHEQIKRSIGGTVTESIPVPGGLVHEVIRMSNGTDYFFLKKRSPSFVKVEGIVVRESDVAYEYSALQFFHGAFPHLFPKPLMVDVEKGLLLMKDALPGGKQFIEELAASDSAQTLQTATRLGTILGQIHRYSKGKTDQVQCNPNNDFTEILDYRYSYHGIDALDKVVASIRNNREHVLHGGLSPKNILTSPSGIAFVDLETACAGDPIFDYAFCIAHILLHHIKDPAFGVQLLQAYETAYSPTPDSEFESSQVIILILGTFLYRLDNSRVPYALNNINTEERQRIVAEIKSRLAKGVFERSKIFHLL